MGYSQKLVNTVIRLAKKDSAFVYFQLEGNENLCFYSTLNTIGLGDDRSDLLLTTTMEFKEEFNQLLEQLQKHTPMDIVSKEEITDSPDGHMKYER